MTTPPTPHLSPVEARVLAVLAEKQKTVPDTYPLSLNALVSGCNQKTSRDPVMELTDGEAQEAIDSLRGMNFVIESSGGRVPRYSHNMERVLQVPPQSAALLTSLMLRGPQTAGELRINCDRLHKFADISSVEGFLRELAERPAGALTMELQRQPGSRENRWAHLLSGAPDVEAAPVAPSKTAFRTDDTGPLAALADRVEALEAKVAELQALIEAERSKRD